MRVWTLVVGESSQQVVDGNSLRTLEVEGCAIAGVEDRMTELQ